MSDDVLLCLTDFLSECSLASPDSPCTNLEAENCKYEHFDGDHCCCGQCGGWLTLACLPNLNTGDLVWQKKYLFCSAEGCGSEGEWWI